jgi:carbonic anhydrase
MTDLNQLFDNNRRWAARHLAADKDFFRRLSEQQTPAHLWIGCADSRVPANEIVGLLPGELFVHRNVANIVVHTDLNCLSVLQYAVDVLKVKHVIVCGHYGCVGVRAALDDAKLGLIDNWLRHVQDVHKKHRAAIDAIDGVETRLARLCELNVLEQVRNVCETTILRDAWARGQSVMVHGWIYGLSDGRLKNLGLAAASWDELETQAAAVTRA